jgi:hypothetical protein
VQVCYCVFDIIVLVLSCPAFCKQHSASVNVFKIAIREFIPAFRILLLLVVNPKMPIIFLLRGRLVFAPRTPLVEYKSSNLDEFFDMFKCRWVQCDGLDFCLLI